MKFFVYIISFFLCTICTAQQVHFAHGSEMFQENIKTFQSPESNDAELVDGKYVRYIQFRQILNNEQRKSLESSGLQLIGYIDFGAYLTVIPAGFDLKSVEIAGAKSIIKPAPAWKMHRNLKERPLGEWAVNGDLVDVSIKVYPHISIDKGAEMALSNKMTVLEKGKQNGYLLVRIDQKDLEKVAELPFVQWIELKAEPGEKEDLNGRSLHRANLLDSDHALGLKYNGEGVKILVRDDGAVGPHIDFEGRLYNQEGVSAPTSGTHGDGVAGIIGGAGNLDPTKKGMAAGADVYVINYSAQFQDATLPLFLNENVTITNSSYSNGCNAGYTIAAQTVDQQIFQYNTLMHVFSAGNSNNTDCGYGAGDQWGNITGGHKMAKNAIATANLRVNGVIETSSSRGPAHDGRIKPDISAHGTSQNSTNPNNAYQVFGGTSAAAPGIAGCLGQLTHAYKTIYNEPNAPTALLKVAILNTANEMGNIGPDFKFGWGHINNFKALKLLEQHRFDKGEVENGTTNTHTINIPANVKQAKMMVYWVDPPASVNAAKALLNDLDLTVTGPNGTVYRPWKLNPTPDPVLLDTPAGVGRDSLNNMEQVAINTPVPGVYTVNVNGFQVPFGPQPYYISWEFLDDKVKLVYPNGGESFVPGTKEWIRWDAFSDAGAFSLKYSTDGGASYTSITAPGASSRMFEWTVPNVTSGNVKLVITRGADSDTSDFSLNISPQPTNLAITKVCPDSVTLQWTKINDATLNYEIFQLGEKYMELKGSTPDNVSQWKIALADPAQPTWFSIRAAKEDGMLGRRINAVPWSGGLLGCPQNYDLSLLAILSPTVTSEISCTPLTRTVAITVKNEGALAISNGMAHFQMGNQSVTEPLGTILQPGQSFDFQFATPLILDKNGVFNLKTSVSVANENYFANNSLDFTINAVVEPLQTSFAEDFESAALPNGWAVLNPDSDITWIQANATGIDGNPTRAMYLNHYSYNDRGELDYLYLPPLDLSSNETPYLVFDYSHKQYDPSYVEGLRVEAFAGCNTNGTPVVLWEKSDPELSIGSSTDPFTPSDDSDWRKVELSLNQFVGQSVLLRFTALNDYGNNTYLDNIAIQNRTAPLAQIGTSTTAECQNDIAVFTATAGPGENVLYQWNFGAGAEPATALGQGPVSVNFNTPGAHTIELIASNAFGSDTTGLEIWLNSLPSGTIQSSVIAQAASFTSTVQNTTGIFWQFGDGATSTDPNPEHVYADNGVYTVTATLSNECGETVVEEMVTIANLPVSDFSANITSGCAPFVVNYAPIASVGSTTYQWAFPGGMPSASTDSNPVVSYSTPGVYDVILTATNTVGSTTQNILSLITVTGNPVADFEVSNNNQLTIEIMNVSTGASSYFWDFGDGSTSTENVSSHTYANDGIYTITLTATNFCGSSTFVVPVTVATPPAAVFSVDNAIACAPSLVQFINQSSPNTTSIIWEFPGGEPATSTATNPTVQYNNPGAYTVRLIARNAFGSDTITQINLIEVLPLPVASFTANINQTEVLFFGNLQFADNFIWDLGDGATSTMPNVAHTYTADGIYTVTLFANNHCGSDTFTQEITIKTPPLAAFIANNTQGCVPLTVQYSNQSTANATGLEWTFPGGTPETSTETNPTVVYTAPGTYSAVLRAFNEQGESILNQSDLVTVTASPASFFTTTTDGLTVGFTNQSSLGSSYQWTFGTGATSTDFSPVYTFPEAGIYEVTLTASNACGSSNYLSYVELGSIPVAQMSADTTTGCPPLTVQFQDESTGYPSFWNWSFQGGMPQSGQNPSPVVTYTTPGTYNVDLEVTNYWGTDFTLKNQYITVLPLVDAQFEYVESTNGLFTFNNNSNNATSYLWEFGDGATSTEASPLHQYTQSGAYTVYLYATGPCNTDAYFKTFLVSVGTDDLPEWISSAKIFPNPGNGNFTLDLTGASSGVLELTLYNHLGQLVRREVSDFSTGKLVRQLDYEGLPAGAYRLSVGDQHGVFSLPVLILER